MRTTRRFRGLIDQAPEPRARIPAQPPVHRLAGHPITASHIRDRRTLIEHLEHSLKTLLHHPNSTNTAMGLLRSG
jgi:hypothetical protein